MNLLFTLLVLAVFGYCKCGTLPKPTALTVDCQSLGDGEEFKNRLKIRQNAEDHTTIWLLKGEQLTINFELTSAAMIEVLDLRYSNDGDWDEIGLTLDSEDLGHFKTGGEYAWGNMWNTFKSSGPVGGLQMLQAGKHSLTIKIVEADVYGVEIDYIRLNVHGATLQKLSRSQFICVHKPGDNMSDNQKSGQTPSI